MIVKKLSDAKGGGFPGARYNEDKVADGVAELMLMANVSERLRHTVLMMYRFGLDAATEVERYLKEHSKTYGNTKTDRFQFHVSASVRGKEELTDFAQKPMKEMGYEKQPYFVYAHHDTDNNHVHILSTRIKPNGFPISDHQDVRRLNACANHILASDISQDIERVLSYDYETEGQFANVVRSFGFKMEKSLDGYRLLKNGGDAGNISVGDIFNYITKNSQKRKDRATQLRAIIKKYKTEIAEGKSQSLNSPEVSKSKKKKPTRPRTNPDIKKILDKNGRPLSKEQQEQLQLLLNVLKTKFGVEIYFQKDKNGQVRGYGLVDHATKIAFDGSKVMKLSELIDFAQQQVRKPSPLDIYRDIFSPTIFGCEDNVLMEIQMKDGSTYQKAITPRQFEWFKNVSAEEKDEVAYTIAATMFSEEILMSYLKWHTAKELRDSIQAVYAPKHKNGGYCLRIEMKDGYSIPLMKMDEKDEIEFRNISPQERESFLLNLAVDYLTRSEAEEIIKHIRRTMREQIKRDQYVLPKQQDFTPQMSQTFVHTLTNAISRFNVEGGSQSKNREWEVGNRSPYDDLDTRQSGTRISM